MNNSTFHLLSTYHVLAILFLTVCGGDTLSPHLLSYRMTRVFHMAFAPLGIALLRKLTVEHRHQRQILLNVQ